MKLAYEDWNPSDKSMALVAIANKILEEYAAQGFVLTLRQLYYQFVARDYLPNTERSYKNLGNIINKGRMAGMIDWKHLVDRTRELRALSHWENPREIIDTCVHQYKIDKWKDQRFRIEVWVEKDALIDIIRQACEPLDVPYLSCRGYTSQSEMWAAGQRILKYAAYQQEILIVHLGDHDPSGLDMSRDIRQRLNTFTDMIGFKFERIALNMDQVDEYDPPPNPAKITDSRCKAYMLEFGDESWELDALEPKVIVDLVQKIIKNHTHAGLWNEANRRERDERKQLEKIAKRL